MFPKPSIAISAMIQNPLPKFFGIFLSAAFVFLNIFFSCIGFAAFSDIWNYTFLADFHIYSITVFAFCQLFCKKIYN
jgi:hypothetical protein